MTDIFKILFIAIGLLFCSKSHSQDRPFITTWKTDNSGLSCDSCIEIPTAAGEYSYNVDWGDGNGVDTTLYTGNAFHQYDEPGTYTVSITGRFSRIFFAWHSDNDDNKIISIDQWGDTEWTSMSYAFSGCDSLQLLAVDAPDLSKVSTVKSMLAYTLVNVDLSHWDVSSVENMEEMFAHTKFFNGDISNWDVSNVEFMSGMFENADSFNRNISNWNVSKVKTMNGMFKDAEEFNQDISNWDVSSVGNFDEMFQNATSFNQDLSRWNLLNARRISEMFDGAISFNSDISQWNVSNVTAMSGTFRGAVNFDSDISNWDVSNVGNMSSMFSFSNFSGDLEKWDVSNVKQMGLMFHSNPSFNNNLSGWDVSNTLNMYGMFENAISFNGDIDGWNVSSVQSFANMFKGAISFNQDLNKWTTSSAIWMNHMLQNATSFDQSLSNWDFSSLNEEFDSVQDILDSCGMSTSNYEHTLKGWGENPNTPNGKNFTHRTLTYCDTVGVQLLKDKGWGMSGHRKLTEAEGCFPSSISDEFASDIKIYPNPVQLVLNLDFLDIQNKYHIMDISGKIIKMGSIDRKLSISVNDFDSGVYFIKIFNDSNQVTKRFIKI